MSSISGTQASSGLFQFLQSLSSSSSASASSANSSSGSAAGSAATSALSALGGHHHHKHGGGGGFEKLADAVSSALQSASNSSTGSTTNANQTITDALTKIFKNGSLGGPVPTDDDNDGSSDGTGSSTTTGTEGTDTTNGLPASFAATLQSFGVTPQQFQQDLTAALQSAQQSGTTDVSAAFKSFPPGSVVDTIG